MIKKAFTPALCFCSLLLVTSVSHAFIKSSGSEREKVYENSTLNDVYETTGVAEQIWDRLTTEFVNYYEKGRYTNATATAKAAYDLSMSAFGPNHINTADSMLKLGIVYETLGDLKSAKDYMLRAKTILEDKLGPNHEDVAVVLTNLANVYFEENEVEMSEKYHLRALQIRKDSMGERDVAVAQSQYNLAVLYDDILDYEKAVKYYESAINIWNSTLGAAHPYVANALNNLANVYMAMDKMDLAEELHNHSLAIRKILYGNVHAEVARSLINLGALHVKQNNYDKAKPYYKEAVSVAEKLFGPTHPQVAMLLYSLANIYHIQGRMDRNQEEELAVKKVNFNPAQTGKFNTVDQLNSKISNLHKSSETYFAQALPLYERALKILDNTIGTDHPAMSAMISELALLYKSIGRNFDAEQMQARIHKPN